MLPFTEGERTKQEQEHRTFFFKQKVLHRLDSVNLLLYARTSKHWCLKSYVITYGGSLCIDPFCWTNQYLKSSNYKKKSKHCLFPVHLNTSQTESWSEEKERGRLVN